MHLFHRHLLRFHFALTIFCASVLQSASIDLKVDELSPIEDKIKKFESMVPKISFSNLEPAEEEQLKSTADRLGFTPRPKVHSVKKEHNFQPATSRGQGSSIEISDRSDCSDPTHALVKACHTPKYVGTPFDDMLQQHDHRFRFSAHAALKGRRIESMATDLFYVFETILQKERRRRETLSLKSGVPDYGAVYQEWIYESGIIVANQGCEFIYIPEPQQLPGIINKTVKLKDGSKQTRQIRTQQTWLALGNGGEKKVVLGFLVDYCGCNAPPPSSPRLSFSPRQTSSSSLALPMPTVDLVAIHVWHDMSDAVRSQNQLKVLDSIIKASTNSENHIAPPPSHWAVLGAASFSDISEEHKPLNSYNALRSLVGGAKSKYVAISTMPAYMGDNLGAMVKDSESHVDASTFYDGTDMISLVTHVIQPLIYLHDLLTIQLTLANRGIVNYDLKEENLVRAPTIWATPERLTKNDINRLFLLDWEGAVKANIPTPLDPVPRSSAHFPPSLAKDLEALQQSKGEDFLSSPRKSTVFYSDSGKTIMLVPRAKHGREIFNSVTSEFFATAYPNNAATAPFLSDIQNGVKLTIIRKKLRRAIKNKLYEKGLEAYENFFFPPRK